MIAIEFFVFRIVERLRLRQLIEGLPITIAAFHKKEEISFSTKFVLDDSNIPPNWECPNGYQAVQYTYVLVL
jgi:hypothetical protein